MSAEQILQAERAAADLMALRSENERLRQLYDNEHTETCLLRTRIETLTHQRDQAVRGGVEAREKIEELENRVKEVRHAFLAALDQVDISPNARTRILVVAAAELLMTALVIKDPGEL